MADQPSQSTDPTAAASATAMPEKPAVTPAASLRLPSSFYPHLPASTDATMSQSPESTTGNDGAFTTASDTHAAAQSTVGGVPATLNGGITKSSSTRPLSGSSGRPLNPRSCVTCRKRKVKCDKLHPCSNCSRAHIECVFPSPGRAPRKSRKVGEGQNKELLDRLRRLESVVQGLGADVPADLAHAVGEARQARRDADDELRQMLDAQQGGEPQDATSGQSVASEGAKMNASASPAFREANGSLAARPGEKTSADEEHQKKTRWVEEASTGHFENRFGRLVVNEGKTRYVNNSFWANLSNEVEDLKGILIQTSDEDEDSDASPDSGRHLPNDHNGFVFGFSSLSADLLKLHPQPGQIKLYWNVFKDRVDPLVKLLHIPTLEPTLLKAASHLANLSRCFECLLFAIYYCATTSLSTEDCKLEFGEEKSVLLTRYQFAIEQALARANFLVSEEMVLLQGFVLFLVCLRRNSDARVIWSLTGVVVRMAQTIGIHRDGQHFRLPPFEVEMRRRLWWQVCLLDVRASEDHGCDPTIVEQSFDTKMPMNINDTDMTPSMTEFPPERQGCTDMSFCLLRFEVANTFRRLNYVPPGPNTTSLHPGTIKLADKERWITECQHKLEDRFLKHCDMSVPLFWVTATVARLMLSKMWLMVYHPAQRQHGGAASLTPEVKEKLFITSLENMEYSLLLETESRTMKWGWLFRTYMQWHALAFMMSELCHRTTGDLVERAWSAVEKTRDGRWGSQYTAGTNTGHLWRPLKKLYRKAKEARRRGLQEEQLLKQRATGLPAPTRTYSPNANPMFGHPAKPRMIRAPLSQAQLQRFAEGPEYGRTPMTSNDLFSTVGSSSQSHSDKSVSSTDRHPGPRPKPKHPLHPLNHRHSVPHVGQCPTAGINADYMSSGSATSNIDFSTLDADLLQTQQPDLPPTSDHPNPFPPPSRANSLPPLSPDPARSIPQPISPLTDSSNTSNRAAGLYNPFDTTPQDANPSSSRPFFPPSAAAANHPSDPSSSSSASFPLDPSSLPDDPMDTSADINWDNWDQLVRQFGMGGDVESMGVPPPPMDGAFANPQRGPFAFSSTVVPNGGFNPGFTTGEDGRVVTVAEGSGGGGGTWGVGGNWEMGMPLSAQNLRMGMGMGGGDWF